jgi:hypothetical protein
MLENEFKNSDISKQVDEHGHTRYFNAEGQLHRDDGPALIATQFVAWYRRGKLHREGKPALEIDDGTGIWFRNGKQHRLDGPAVEIPQIRDGSGNEYWVDDRQLTQQEFALLTRGVQSKTKSRKFGR